MSYRTESTASSAHRDVTIDIAKGLCILLVVCIHSEVFSFAPMPVEFVAVPMFFFMSGCFDRSNRPFSSVMAKGVRTLVFPACVWTLISGLYLGVLKVAKGEPPLFHFDIFTPCTTNGPCWFLVALFWTRLLMWLLEHAFRPKALQAAAVVLLGWLGFRQMLPLYFDDALVALPLYYAGKAAYARRSLWRWRSPAGVLLLVAGLASLLAFAFHGLSFTILPGTWGVEGSGGGYQPFYLAALAGIVLVFPLVMFVSSLLVSQSWLSRLGGQTLGILVVHSPMCHTLAVVLNRLMVKGSVAWIACFLAGYVVIVAASYALAVFVRRRCPLLFGMCKGA